MIPLPLLQWHDSIGRDPINPSRFVAWKSHAQCSDWKRVRTSFRLWPRFHQPSCSLRQFPLPLRGSQAPVWPVLCSQQYGSSGGARPVHIWAFTCRKKYFCKWSVRYIPHHILSWFMLYIPWYPIMGPASHLVKNPHGFEWPDTKYGYLYGY